MQGSAFRVQFGALNLGAGDGIDVPAKRSSTREKPRGRAAKIDRRSLRRTARLRRTEFRTRGELAVHRLIIPALDLTLRPRHPRGVNPLIGFVAILALPLVPVKLKAEEISNAAVSETVSTLLHGSYSNIPEDAAVRAKVKARLVSILEDPASLKTGYPNAQGDFLATCAMKALKYVAPEESPRFIALAQHSDVELRNETLIALASSLDPRAVEPITPTLRKFNLEDTFHLVTAMQYELTKRKRTAPPAFVDAIWPELEKGLTEGSQTENIAELLCALNPRRAAESLCTADRLNLKNPRLREISRAFNKARVTIPADRLIPLIKMCLSKRELSEQAQGCLEPALVCLVRQKHPRAKEWIDQILADGIPKPPPFPVKRKSPNEIFKATSASIRFNAATEALLRYHGIEMYTYELGLIEDPRRTKDEQNKPLWHAYVVTEYLYDVNSGGHYEFYAEDYEQHLIDRLPESLEAIGATDYLELYLQSNAAWGERNPIKHPKLFHAGDSEPTPAQKRLLHDLDTRFYHLNSNQSLSSILALYVIKHLEDFRHLR